MMRFRRFIRWVASSALVALIAILAEQDFSHRWTGWPSPHPSPIEIVMAVVTVVKESPFLMGISIIIALCVFQGFMRLLSSRAMLDVPR